MKTLPFLLLGVVLTFVTMGSDCGDPKPPQIGFNIRTDLGTFNQFGIAVIVRHPFVNIRGIHLLDAPFASGTTVNLPSFATTDGNGFYQVPQGRAPSVWRLGEDSGPCRGKTFETDIEPVSTFPMLCDTTCLFIPCTGNTPFNSIPSAMSGDNPPATVTITGENISAAYGMPTVGYYDENGNLYAQALATQVAPNGSWLSGATPDISSVPSGSYWAMVQNVAGDGSLQTIGAARVYIYNLQPPPDPGPCNYNQYNTSQMERPICS